MQSSSPAGTGPDARERVRLETLRDYGALDSLAGPAYEALVRLAAYVCGTQVSAVSLVDAERQWFRASTGLKVEHTARAGSFCAQAIESPDRLLVVPDAAEDPRFHDNPLVTGPPSIRFYAGAPLVSSDGIALGSLCVLDTVPRVLTRWQQQALTDLARQVMALLESQRTSARLAVAIAERDLAADDARLVEQQLESAFGHSPVGLLAVSLDGVVVRANAAFALLLGRTVDGLRGVRLDALGGAHDVVALLAHEEADRGTWVHEVPYAGVDGPVMTLTTTTLVRDDTGAARLFLCQVDPSDQRQHVEDLLLDNRSATDALITVDDRGLITSWNVGAERMFGHRRVSAVGRSLEMIMPADLWPKHRAGLARLASGGTPVLLGKAVEVPAVRADGMVFPIELTLSRWHRQDRTMITAVVRDISERRALEDARRHREQLAALVSAVAVAANRSTSVSVTAHEVLELVCTHGGWPAARLRWQDAQGSQGDVCWPASAAEQWAAGTRVAALPVSVRDQVVGALELVADGLDQDVCQALEQVALHVGRVVERELTAAALRRQAASDPLTGLPNRTAVAERLEAVRARAGGTASGVSVFFIDLDQFKLVNDLWGHAVGDQLLVAVAGRLTSGLRPGDVLARLGGDEFVVLCEQLSEQGLAGELATRLSAALDAPFVLAGVTLHISASIGFVVDDGQVGGDELLIRADAAMYAAKASGQGRVAAFDDRALLATRQRLRDQTDLQHALTRQELSLVYQPVVEVDTGRTTGVEALLRWSRAGEQVPPARFIPLAEETGLIVEIGDWVLRTACAQMVAWGQQRPELSELHLAVNFSTRQLRQPDVADQVARALRDSGLPAERLTLELTESALAEDGDQARQHIQAIAALGVRLAVDDFGTGYCSLAYLRRFEVHALKIDKSFVDDIGPGGHGQALTEVVIAMASALGLQVIAEGVETRYQADALLAMGCGLAQGYLWSPPQPPSALPAAVEVVGWPRIPRERVLKTEAENNRVG